MRAEFSNQHLRPGILTFDAAHVEAAYFFGVNVCHWAKLGAFSFLFYKNKNSHYLLLHCCPRSDLRCRPLRNYTRFPGEAFIVEFITEFVEKFLNQVSFRPRKASVLTVFLTSIFRPGVFAFEGCHPEKTGQVFLLRISLE